MKQKTFLSLSMALLFTLSSCAHSTQTFEQEKEPTKSQSTLVASETHLVQEEISQEEREYIDLFVNTSLSNLDLEESSFYGPFIYLTSIHASLLRNPEFETTETMKNFAQSLTQEQDLPLYKIKKDDFVAYLSAISPHIQNEEDAMATFDLENTVSMYDIKAVSSKIWLDYVSFQEDRVYIPVAGVGGIGFGNRLDENFEITKKDENIVFQVYRFHQNFDKREETRFYYQFTMVKNDGPMGSTLKPLYKISDIQKIKTETHPFSN